MWGAKVKMPVDVPDDMLKDALETSSRVIDQYPDFENDGECSGGLVLGLGAGAVKRPHLPPGSLCFRTCFCRVENCRDCEEGV